jgi:flagellar hook-length control protein FliK
MPQVIDIAKQLVPAGAKAVRSPRGEQPTTRFKDAIEQHSRRPEPKAEEPQPAERAAKPQKPATKKADRSDTAEEDLPANEAAKPDEAKAAPKSIEGEAADEAAEDGDAVATDADAEKQEGDEADPDQTDAAALAALIGQPAAKPVEELPGDVADAGPQAGATQAVGEVAEAASLQPQAKMPTSGAQTDAAETLQADAAKATDSAADDGESAGRFQLPGAETAEAVAGNVDLSKQFAAGKNPSDAPATTDSGIDTLTTPQSPEAKQASPTSAALTQPVVKASVSPEQHFVDNNADKIITSIRGQLMPTGGSMKIRLDPPNMGQLQINVTVDRDGTISAAFQTSNEDAAKLLSHSIQHLKTAIESTGVAVDRIQVKQASPGESSGNAQNSDRDRDQQQNPQDHPARQEQQRREMLQRMWAKLAGTSDDLDLVA